MVSTELVKDFRVVSSFIAKWALPNEGIPLFLLWEGKLSFDLIAIEMPKDLRIREYYNISKKYQNPRIIHIDELKTQNYLGFVFTAPLLKKISREVKLIINFLRDSKVIYQQEFKTRIIRPKIEFQVPKEVEISSTGKMKIDVKLRYTGYGNTYGKIMVSEDKEKLVFNVKNFHELFLVISNAYLFKEFMKKNKISEKEFIGIELPEDQYNYRNFLINSTEMREFTSGDFFRSIKSIMDNKKMMEIIEKSIEESTNIATNFFTSIIDFVEKRPVENVFLHDSKIESIELDVGKRLLYVCNGYIDDFGNYYSEITEIPIVIEKKQIINFSQNWEEQVGDWSWLRETQ